MTETSETHISEKNPQDIEPKTTPRRKWKRWVALLLLLIIGPTQYLNHTGFCYAEMKYLSERDIVGRMSFGAEYLRMNDAQKDRRWKEYNGCCGAQVNIEDRWLYQKNRYCIG